MRPMRLAAFAIALLPLGAAEAAGFAEVPASKSYRVMQAEATLGKEFWVYVDTPWCQATMGVHPRPKADAIRETYISEKPVKVKIVDVLDDASWIKVAIDGGGAGFILSAKVPKLEPLKEGDDMRLRCYAIEPPEVVAEFRAAEEKRKATIATACEAAGYRKGVPQVGMSEWDVVECAIGKPDAINRTSTADGTRQQWVYRLRKTYVYVENGKVTAIQY